MGGSIVAAVILDRDYRSDRECESIVEKCSKFCDFVSILKRKEIENFLLVPTAIDRAAESKAIDRAQRAGISVSYEKSAQQILDEFAVANRAYVAGQRLSSQRLFERTNSPQTHEASVTESSYKEFEKTWETEPSRMNVLPGKDALSAINTKLQETYSVTVTASSIIGAMEEQEVPEEMMELLSMLREFATKSTPSGAT